MPRYFFHTRIGDTVLTDAVGTDLRDADQAWIVARDTIQSLMTEPGSQARLFGACLIVTDAAGETVLEFPFAEAMVSAPAPGASRH